MSNKLFKGLVNIGGILTETYYRNSKATSEARTELGLPTTGDINASIGVASVTELMYEELTDIGRDEQGVFDTAKYEQAVQLVGLYCREMNSAKFEILLSSNNGTIPYQYTVNKNLAFYPVPKLVIPLGYTLRILGNNPVSSITGVFKVFSDMTPPTILAA